MHFDGGTGCTMLTKCQTAPVGTTVGAIPCWEIVAQMIYVFVTPEEAEQANEWNNVIA
jgi:hypothetical protein